MAIEVVNRLGINVGDYLLGLECGHYWPGTAANDHAAQETLDLLKATGDTAECPKCRKQQRITGPVAKVIGD